MASSSTFSFKSKTILSLSQGLYEKQEDSETETENWRFILQQYAKIWYVSGHMLYNNNLGPNCWSW